ncbi:hypothetical protein [Streptomyces sp. NPDC006334]|uniref:glycine-rich domain-containing protein n=1 Tax=Streptomyces sp. NPDC006334 TaxID=3156754 RepID=UPI00339E4393
MDSTGQLTMKPGTMGLREMLIFDTPGTVLFQKANYPWLARLRVRVQAGGGGAAGADADPGECIVRTGGTGGGYSEALIEAAALGATETIVVGAGGAGGVGNQPGEDGGGSSFGAFATAFGGIGSGDIQTSGTSIDVTTGALGPLGGAGDWAQGGGPSGAAIRLAGNRGVSGAGGDSFMGHGGREVTFQTSGSVSRGYGSGGSGGVSYGNPVNGGPGSRGIVIVELYG